jgi:RHS repeat-associated protein
VPAAFDHTLTRDELGYLLSSRAGVFRKNSIRDKNTQSAAGPQLGKKSATVHEDPFGNVIKAIGSAANAQPFGFSTKYTDTETGLVYYGMRWYSPNVGRWLSRDKIQENGGLNLYGFVGNHSINAIDYLGREETKPMGTLQELYPNQANKLDAVVPKVPIPKSSDLTPGFDVELGPSTTVPNAVGSGSDIAANLLEIGTMQMMLKQGMTQCQQQQARGNQKCACCIIRIYQVVQSAMFVTRSVYHYGYARVVSTPCDKVDRKNWDGSNEIMPDYTGKSAMSKRLNYQNPLTDYIPW